jgi:hypothetical protein
MVMMRPGFDGGDCLDLQFVLEKAFGAKLGGLLDVEPKSVDAMFGFIESRIEIRDKRDLNFMSCPTSRAFLNFKKTVEQCQPELVSHLTPSTDLEELIPEDARPEFWRTLCKKGLRLPHLGAPVWCDLFAPTADMMVLSAFAVYLGAYAPNMLWLLFIAFPVALVTSISITPRVFWKWARKIPRPLNTARGMAIYLAYRDCKLQWIPRMSRRQVKDVVRLAVALEYDVPLKEVDDYPLPFPPRN